MFYYQDEFSLFLLFKIFKLLSFLIFFINEHRNFKNNVSKIFDNVFKNNQIILEKSLEKDENLVKSLTHLNKFNKTAMNQLKEKLWRLGSIRLYNEYNLIHNNDNNIQVVNEILFFNFIRNISFYVESCSIDLKDISNHLNLFQIIIRTLNNIPNTHENIKRIIEVNILITLKK